MEQTNLLNKVVSKETIDSFELETQNWTEDNMRELYESMTLAFKENWDLWTHDPELAYEECRDQVQDILLSERLFQLRWEEDTREQDAVVDRLLLEVAEAARRTFEFFNQPETDEERPPTTPRLTTVEPTLPPPPPIKLSHTRNVDGDFGMYVNSNECGCNGCRRYREEQEPEHILNQYRW
jgi:hypothetical protein